MRKNIYIYNWLIILIIGLGAVIACGELDDTHEEFIKDGEQIYVGKPVEIFTNSGNERIRFNIVISADPKITKGWVSWNSGAESQEFDVSRSSEGIDTLAVELNVPEGSYVFEIVLMDNQGNESLSVDHSATVYGEKYISSLFNRAISNVEALPTKAIISWSAPEPGVVMTVFSYEDNNGEMQEVTVLPTETETIAENYKIGGNYTLVTKYIPNALALESFSAASESSTFPSVVSLDRSLWQKVVLPTDAPMACYGGSIENLWDGNKGSWYHSGCTPEDGIPHHFTIDLGILAGLSKFRVTPRQECCQGRNPKKFQIWGIQDIENAETTAAPDDPNWADDAIAKGWVLLLDAEADASWNGSKDDYDVEIPENISVKYIRFRFLEAFVDEGGQTALSEFNFWATSVN